MNLEGLRSYIQLATGLTDVTRERARTAAKSLLAQSEAVVPPPVRAQVGALTDDLVATSRANRHLLVNLVRTEVERSVSRLGLVSARELDAASRRAASLERRVAELEQELTRTRSGSRTAKKSTAPKTAAKERAAATGATRRSTATKSSASKSSASKSSARKSSTRKTTGSASSAGRA